jgi:hypothetical protein
MQLNRKQRKQVPKQKRSAQKVDQDGNILPPGVMTKIPKSINLVFPDKMTVRLKYTASTLINIPVATGYNFLYYTPTSAYDVDPTVGSTAMPGFSEMATFYSTYRVVKSGLKVDAILPSTDGIPGNSCIMVIVPLNASPTASTYLNVVGWRGNTYSQSRLLPITANPVRLAASMTTEKIYGSRAIYYDDNFASPVTTVPNNNWYWGIGFTSDALPPLATFDVSVYVQVDADVEFFARKRLNA